jgi:hypothetical protein
MVKKKRKYNRRPNTIELTMEEFNRKNAVKTHTKYNAKLHRKIIKLVRAGNDAVVAAVAAGISRATFRKWENDFLGYGERSRYIKLFIAIDKAEQLFETEMVKRLRKGARNDPRFAIEYLKRKKRDRWGDKQTTELTGPGGGPVVMENIRTKVISRIKQIQKATMAQKKRDK